MVRFTLRQCVYFLAVADHGGIAQAARALSISQPAVAQAVDKLEAVTGLVLFDRRHARGLTLTMQGRLFRDQAARLVDHARQVAQEAAGLAAGTAGEIRLGMFWTLAPFYAAGLIRSFAAAAPDVTIRQQEMSLAGLADALRAGTLDFAVTYDPGAGSEGLVLRPLARLRPAVVVAADHPLAGRSAVALAELAHEPYVMFDAPGSRGYFERLLAEGGIAPRVAYASASLEAVRSAVAAGLGFTLLVMRPPSDLTYGGGAVRLVEIADPVPPLPIVLAARSDARASPVAERFAAHAQAWFAARHPG